jgi:two-component system sensor kinase
MTALRMDLTQLEREAGAGPLDRERLRAMRELIDATLASARRIAAELRPAILDDLGLAAAVEQVAADFERRASIACAAHVPDGGADMDRRAALALYRILQEALTNVARHAGATRVDITLSVEDGTVALVVTDDGRGFEPEAAGADATRPSLGLLGMRERALALGGELRVDARPGQGTAVSARVPRRPPGPGDGSP